jgi:LCP family protein required for cell wall assembly
MEIRRLRNIFLLAGLALLVVALMGIFDLLPRSFSAKRHLGLLASGQLAGRTPTAAESNFSTIATNTPIQTRTPTLTPYPVVYNEKGTSIPNTWGAYAGPQTFPSTPIPPPIGLLPKPEGQVSIVLLGNDHRPKLGTRTDAIMLLTLNPEQGTASIVSFPRDLYVYAPGWSMLKLNTVMPRGNWELLAQTFEYNFGVRPDFYINISMTFFEEVVDSLGGIDVVVTQPLSDPTYAGGRFSVSAGLVHMDGRTARWYVRSRNTSNDILRAERQQEVLKAIFLKLMSRDGVARAPELFARYSRWVATNLTLGDVLPLTPLALKLTDTTRITRYAIGFDQTTEWRTPIDRAYVLLPDQLAILQIILQAISP